MPFLSACLAVSSIQAQPALRPDYLDSVEVSLLTCQPHDEVYSLYGHTALRWHDLHPGGIDAAFNYGVFDFNRPHFVLRFVFGLTDYELGAFPFRLFCAEYRHFGSKVTEQILNLTRQEKAVLFDALRDNLRPENAVYRYNFFYNNCTTKARDIIEQCINGHIEYTERKEYTPSFREIIHSMTHKNPWSRFGNDLLLGVKADLPTDRREQEFLPDHLMYDFDHAVICHNDSTRPLVLTTRTAVPAGVPLTQDGFPLTPAECAWLLLTMAVILFVAQWRRGRSFLVWDVLLMVATGTLGIILTLMLFSQHPTVSLNLQIILLNPLPWIYLWPVVRRRDTRYWSLTALLCILFLAGNLVQHYAEGIHVLALCLLLQCCVHRRDMLQRWVTMSLAGRKNH